MKPLALTISLLMLALLMLAIAPHQQAQKASQDSDANYVWFEGEAASKNNFRNGSWFAASKYAKAKEVLSGGDWLVSAGDRKGDALSAEWQVEVPKSANFQFWVRKFWLHGPFKWRFGKDEWQQCGRNVGLEDNASLETHVGANWVWLGEVKLGKGSKTLEIELLAKEGQSATACFDCFLLIDGAFQPRGAMKPGEKSGKADAGSFAFEPDLEGKDEGLFDLRRLNEKEAGESGFVTQKKGEFIRGDGTPMRFWGVNIGKGILELGNASIDHLSILLARRGVNGVRIHSALFDSKADNPEAVDMHTLDRLHYAVAAFKREGIYSSLSFYFPLWFDIRDSYGLKGYDKTENKKPFATIFFSERMQEIHRAWAKVLLTTINPYTKKKLADEPAVSQIEIVNEDSLFFWTFTDRNIPEPQLKDIETQFGTWLKKKHGSAASAAKKWGAEAAQDRDDANAGRMKLMDAWHMTGGAQASLNNGMKKRMLDQVAFMVELQRNYYEGEVEYMRKKLDAKQLISCSNWHTADPSTLEPIEHYTYHAADVMDRHAYFGGKHEGEGANFSVRVGHTFTSASALHAPHASPFANPRFEDLPETYSEIGWPSPNRFRAEWPFMSAAYGSLQGIDGFYHFAINSGYWSSAAEKFMVSDPAALGSFPALALAYRRGDIAEGKGIVTESLSLDDLLEFKGTRLPQSVNLDALRGGGGSDTEAAVTALKLAPFVGKVTQEFGRRSKLTINKAALKKGINGKRSSIASETKELVLNFKEGVMMIDAPRVQGACGFLGAAGEIKLGDCALSAKNEYISLTIIALDDAELKKCQRILLQAIPENRPYGWRDEDGKITATGGYPMNVKEVDATLVIKRREAPTRIVALDANGKALEAKVVWEQKGGEITITLPKDSLYTLVEFAAR